MDTAAAVPSEPRLWNVARRLRDLARRDWLAYGFAAVAPFLVLWLHQVLTSSTVLHIQIRQAHTQQNMQGFLQFLVVVIPSAYLGGAGPGLVSTLVAAGIMGRFLLPHASAFDLWRLAPILVFGVLVSALIEHRHRREGRRTANSRLAQVTLASIGDAVIATDGKGNITFMNREAERLTGWDNSQAVGRPIADVFRILNEETRDPSENPVEKAMRLGATTRLTNHTLLLCKDGHEISICERAAPIRHPDGTLEGVVVVFHDATQSRTAETELQKRIELQQHVGRIVNTAPAVIYSFRLRPDGTTCFPFASPSIEDILSTSIEEIAKDGNSAFSKIHPDDLARVRESIDESARDLRTWQCEFRVTTRTGGETWLEGRSVPEREADGSTLWYGFLSDIGARKRADAIIERNERKFRSYVENAPIAVFVANQQGRVLECNTAAVDLFGYDPAELKTLSICDLHPPQERDRVLAGMAEMRGAGRIEGEYRCIRKDGQEIWVLLRALMLDRDYSLGFLQDITERKRAEHELSESRQSLQFAMDAGQLGVWRHDLRTDEVVWDDRCRDMLGLLPGEQPSFQGFLDSIGPASSVDFLQWLAGHKQRTAAHLATEYRIKLRDGSERWLLTRATATRDSKGEPVRVDGLLMDITQRKKAEAKIQQLQEQYRHAQKMEAVGRLAGGVAHDFNNLLMVIQGYTEMLRDEMDDAYHGKQYAEQILTASSRAAGLTRQLLAFSRKQILCPVVLNVNCVVEETAKMMTRLLGEDIVCKLDLSPSLWNIKADPDQIGQVLMNLAVNARDAMPQGGVLSIATKNACVKYNGSEEHAWVNAGNYIALTVSDTGKGMAKEVIDHLFEPFFTTKEEGKGTGLGLATVYGIVQQSEGYVWADSEPGRGACFTIYLPATEMRAARPLPALEELSPRGAGTLLVVEDEMSMNRTLVEFLRGRGYTVLTCNSPAEALLTSPSYGFPIDLLITDIVMPGMSGTDLALELGRLRPGIKTIFMSGYIDDAVVRRSITQSNATFLQKPFSLHSLAQKISEVMLKPDSGEKNGSENVVLAGVSHD
jgi:two-component system cell cycle sensor histidine kinase/response regulator CckA